MRVERVAHGVDLPFLRQIYVRDLRPGMHARVRAPCPLYQRFFTRQRFDCRCQHTLHGKLVRLNLPAAERRAVIFDGQLVAGHRLACDRRAGTGRSSKHELSRSHASAFPTRVPALTGVPRKNSSAPIGCFPARCTCTSRTAPSPQAMVSLLSSATPGGPALSPLVERNTFTRTPSSSNQA